MHLPLQEHNLPYLSLTSQLQFHHQEDKLRSQGILCALQITSFMEFLAVNVLGQSTSGRQDADWLTVSGTPPRRSTQEKWLACSATLQQPRPFTRRRPCRSAEIGASKEGCPPTLGPEIRQIFKFQTLATRGINRDFLFLWSLETHTRAFFPTRKQFQNGTRMKITISLFYVAA